jgi:hypothetical protein
MPVPKEMSLSSYLRHHNIRYAESAEYEVSPQIELVVFQAYHLSEMHPQPLHAVDMLKAILHIPGSVAEQLLIQQGLTLEKIHATPLNPNDPPFTCDRLFGAIIKYAQKSPVLSTEHLLLALLEEEVLRPYFALWHIEMEDFYKNVHAKA